MDDVQQHDIHGVNVEHRQLLFLISQMDAYNDWYVHQDCTRMYTKLLAQHNSNVFTYAPPFGLTMFARLDCPGWR